MSVADLLDRPVYGIGQVDRLLGLPSRTARRWIDGYWRGDTFYDPIIRPVPTGNRDVTWGEFVETRLLAEFRDAGVRISRLRLVVAELRETFGDYPLAKTASLLEPVGRNIVMRAQQSAGLDQDLELVELGSGGQLVLSHKAQDFVDAATYEDGRVVQLQPDRDVPGVLIDPLTASGEPAVRAVPTEIIAELHRAGDSAEWIAQLYRLDIDQVRAALRFEQRRAA